MRLAFVSPEAATDGLTRSPVSGGYLYNACVQEQLRALGHAVDDIRTASAGAPNAVRELARSLATYDGVLEDELGFELYTELNALLATAAPQVPVVGLVHVPSVCLSADLDVPARGRESEEVARRERAFLSGLDASIFVSRATLEDTTRLLGAHAPAHVATPGGDHFAPLPPRPAASFHLVSVGHVLPYKGTLELISVLEAFAARIGGRAWTASLVGDEAIDEPYARAVRARLAASSVAKNVTMLGRCSQERVAEILASAHVFVTTSRYESYGIAAAEALAAGLPVVGWAKGGFRQLVEESGNGVVVELNDEATFARVLGELHDNAELARAPAPRAASGRPPAPTWRQAAERIASVFATLASASRRRADEASAKGDAGR